MECFCVVTYVKLLFKLLVFIFSRNKFMFKKFPCFLLLIFHYILWWMFFLIFMYAWVYIIQLIVLVQLCNCSKKWFLYLYLSQCGNNFFNMHCILGFLFYPTDLLFFNLRNAVFFVSCECCLYLIFNMLYCGLNVIIRVAVKVTLCLDIRKLNSFSYVLVQV